MNPIAVRLSDRSYRIAFGAIGPSLTRELRRLGLAGRSALVITSPPIAEAGHRRPVVRALKAAGMRVRIASIPSGESHKRLSAVERLYRAGFRYGLDRRSVVVALGGGVVTDVAGFFAATYMRGIPYVSVPTTLLGMVDAAIGGKTGVDTPEGKNLVGAFWQPGLVWIDRSTLETLPKREWRTGFAEIAKYGVIASAPFFSWLENRVADRPFMGDWGAEHLSTAIRRSVEIKARVVSDDEREKPMGGGREILNFGHTVGHALEAATGYRRLSHGEAISVGMVVAGEIALSRGDWSRVEQQRLRNLLAATDLPIHFPRLSSRERPVFWEALQRDKKNLDGRLRFVLPKRLGRVYVRSGISMSEVRAAALRCGF